MGQFGTASIAGNQIALNVASITFMVPLGLAMAATVRVGLSAGAGDREGVRRAGYTAMMVSVLCMSVFGAIFLAFPQAIANAYFSTNAQDNADAIALTVKFLGVAAAFQIFDGLQVVGALSLRGFEDARARPCGSRAPAVVGRIPSLPAATGLRLPHARRGHLDGAGFIPGFWWRRPPWALTLLLSVAAKPLGKACGQAPQLDSLSG